MRLYQDVKREQELQNKEALDREKLGLQQEAVIIYEIPKTLQFVRNVGIKMLLVLLLLGIAAGVTLIAAYYIVR